jgi:hypothetical protein
LVAFLLGENEWVKRMARAHRLEGTVRPEGRPPKPKNELRTRFLLCPLALPGGYIDGAPLGGRAREDDVHDS